MHVQCVCTHIVTHVHTRVLKRTCVCVHMCVMCVRPNIVVWEAWGTRFWCLRSTVSRTDVVVMKMWETRV